MVLEIKDNSKITAEQWTLISIQEQPCNPNYKRLFKKPDVAVQAFAHHYSHRFQHKFNLRAKKKPDLFSDVLIFIIPPPGKSCLAEHEVIAKLVFHWQQ